MAGLTPLARSFLLPPLLVYLHMGSCHLPYLHSTYLARYRPNQGTYLPTFLTFGFILSVR